MPLYPYANSISGLEQIVNQLRKRFPAKVDAGVLKSLQIAPNNESYVLNTLRSLGLIDAEGKKVDSAVDVFLNTDESKFAEGFSKQVAQAYKALFELHGEDGWKQERTNLIGFFRHEDKSSEVIGTRQADTFIKLAEISGMREHNKSQRPSSSAPRPKTPTTIKAKAPTITPTNVHQSVTSQETDKAARENVSLSVRVEVNLPATNDQTIYDAIFSSIRKQLIDRE